MGTVQSVPLLQLTNYIYTPPNSFSSDRAMTVVGCIVIRGNILDWSTTSSCWEVLGVRGGCTKHHDFFKFCVSQLFVSVSISLFCVINSLQFLFLLKVFQEISSSLAAMLCVSLFWITKNIGLHLNYPFTTSSIYNRLYPELSFLVVHHFYGLGCNACVIIWFYLSFFF